MMTTEVQPHLDDSHLDSMTADELMTIVQARIGTRVRTTSSSSTGSGDGRPRTGSHGRKCSPKKGGAGGKGTWGKLGDEINATTKVVDKNDPNYDETDSIVMKVTTYDASVEDIDDLVTPLVTECFAGSDTSDVVWQCQQTSLGKNAYYVPQLITRMGIEKNDPEREVASRLISDLYGAGIVKSSDVSRAFNNLLHDLDDLKLDTPSATGVLGRFIARAVADDCIPPAYIRQHPRIEEPSHNAKALRKAMNLINMKGGMVKLDDVWGSTANCKPVDFAKSKMQLLLQEYDSAQDVIEAERCLRELCVPHFHHELVYEAISLVVNNSSDRVARSMLDLLGHFDNINLITPNQMRVGFERAASEVSDWLLDVPRADFLMSEFADRCVERNIIEQDTRQLVPVVHGRKRFLSENDGGKVKC